MRDTITFALTIVAIVAILFAGGLYDSRSAAREEITVLGEQLRSSQALTERAIAQTEEAVLLATQMRSVMATRMEGCQ